MKRPVGAGPRVLAIGGNRADLYEAFGYDKKSSTVPEKKKHGFVCRKRPIELDWTSRRSFHDKSIQEAAREGRPFSVVILDGMGPRNSMAVVEGIWKADPRVQILQCLPALTSLWAFGVSRLSRSDQWIFLQKPFNGKEIRQLTMALTRKWYQVEVAYSNVRGAGIMDNAQTVNPPRGRRKDFLDSRVANLRTRLRRLETRLKDMTKIREQALSEIQERARLEKVLQQKTVALERSNRDLLHFASAAAHDLQEPLHSIMVFLDLLKVKYGSRLEPKGIEYVRRTQGAALRLQKLIQGMLSLSQVDGGLPQEHPVALGQLVGDIVVDLKKKIEEVNGVVQVGSLPTIHGHTPHLRQLFQNLIVNGLKFHQPGQSPVVSISGHLMVDRRISATDNKPRTLCRVDIRDQGIGIPEEQQGKIFRMFKRLHRNDQYEGAGIGLALCKRIVERYGGGISVKSSVGRGSTFTVTLPANMEDTYS